MSQSEKNLPPRTRIVKCPSCRKETVYSPENEWRPFCSQRCYSLDLGAWASEGYRIAAEEEDSTEEEERRQAP